MPEFARWITERDYRAALMAAGLALLPMLAPLSCAVLSLAALQRGPGAGWRAAAGAAVLLVLVGLAAGAHPLAGVISALMIWAPTLAVTQLLISSGSLSAAARLATIGALLLAGGWALAMPVQGEPWLGLVNELVTPLAIQTGTDPAMLAERLLALMPGIIAASLLMVSLGGLFLAMWLHAALQTPGAFGEAFRALQLGPFVGGIGAVAMIVGVAGGAASVAAVALPAGTALMLQGIAVMHGMVKIRGLHRGWLIGGWVALVVLSPWALMVFAFYGLLDTFLDMRRRAAGRH
jgi:hypothetical protein